MEQRFLRFGIHLVLLMFSMQLFGDNREKELIAHVTRSIAFAEQHRSNVESSVLANQGTSGLKVKCLLNNLCTLPDASYLEVGHWEGSTLLAALACNQLSIKYAVGINQGSQLGENEGAFIGHIQSILPNERFYLSDEDCFLLDKELAFPVPINIYFYDGDHSFASQELAFTFFNDIFEDVFIVVIDDWNSDIVRTGTKSAFAKLQYKVLFERASYTKPKGDPEGWWKGIYIAVIKKPEIASGSE